MARHRSPRSLRSVPQPAPVASPGSHRITPPSPATRGRFVVAAVAAGAVVSAASAADLSGSVEAAGGAAATEGVTLASNPVVALGSGGDLPSPTVLPLPAAARPVEAGPAPVDAVPLARIDVDALAKGERMLTERLQKEADRLRPRFVMPTVGTFTSGFGARWGTNHWGIDLANRIGTPILAAADGVVVESGPASGFGMWVKLRHAGGFTTVYGHIHRSLVEAGEEVGAGQQIAEMGNRGFSTGPHLHFEVWDSEGRKVDPVLWLAQHHLEP